jgi:hypothetical protein
VLSLCSLPAINGSYLSAMAAGAAPTTAGGRGLTTRQRGRCSRPWRRARRRGVRWRVDEGRDRGRWPGGGRSGTEVALLDRLAPASCAGESKQAQGGRKGTWTAARHWRSRRRDFRRSRAQRRASRAEAYLATGGFTRLHGGQRGARRNDSPAIHSGGGSRVSAAESEGVRERGCRKKRRL